ncbi:cell division ATP-binding protein FtsE [uncultured Oscillibacter sp.]|uniref:cell division ATP-binding protein FtsE n=1 Tax=uncultured Oscillibacter sp. TaxID=876091 RepID=UPI0025FC5C50|nr:ATP-binding cassette domain-containing protein [uncultured Oscillibacter sp.]
MPTIELKKVTKRYRFERRQYEAVSQIDLTIRQGEFLFVVGSSGAGKSTLLKLIAGQVRADAGVVLLDGSDVAPLPLIPSVRIRRAVGYVAQEPRLIHRRTIYDNLYMAAQAGGLNREKDAMERIYKALSIVGMRGVERQFPGELSIGQSRRVELARALVNSPPILVLDELTANLDEDNIWDMLHVLSELNRMGTTVVMATHASMFVNIMRRRVVTLVDGRIAGDVAGGRYGEIRGRKVFCTTEK